MIHKRTRSRRGLLPRPLRLLLTLTTLPLLAGGATAQNLWASPCAPPGVTPPLFLLEEDGQGGLLASVDHGPSGGKAFVLARVSDSPPLPAPRSSLPGCAGTSAGTLGQVIDLDGSGRAQVPLAPSLVVPATALCIVTLPPGGTLHDSARSNSVMVRATSGQVSHQSGQVIVTEVMRDPAAVGDHDGEWLELHNPGSSSIDLEGWVLRDAGGERHVLFNDWAGLVIPAGGWLVLGREGELLENGGVNLDHVYSGFTLGNTEDEVILSDGGAVRADTLVFSDAGGWPDTPGASMSLSGGVVDAVQADDVQLWCASQMSWAPGSDLGTPGMANSTCP